MPSTLILHAIPIYNKLWHLCLRLERFRPTNLSKERHGQGGRPLRGLGPPADEPGAVRQGALGAVGATAAAVGVRAAHQGAQGARTMRATAAAAVGPGAGGGGGGECYQR